MGGSKGYFCAIYDEKEGLKINVDEIQLQQPWWIKYTPKNFQTETKSLFWFNLQSLKFSIPKNFYSLFPLKRIYLLSTNLFNQKNNWARNQFFPTYETYQSEFVIYVQLDYFHIFLLWPMIFLIFFCFLLSAYLVPWTTYYELPFLSSTMDG